MPRLLCAARCLARFLLGLFVLWQLVFLLSSNFFGLYKPLRRGLAHVPFLADHVTPPAKDEDVPPGTEPLEKGLRRYAQWTGQSQAWSLFAPNVTDLIPFPAVVLRWDDNEYGEHRMLSDNEPRDRTRYLRLGRFRLRKFESSLDVTPSLSGGTFDPEGAGWAGEIRSRVRAESDSMRAYLRWRLDQFRRSHPDWPPPDEVVLVMRLTRVPPPPGPRPWDWEDLGEYRVARWRPAGDGKLELYDPQTGHYEKVD
jgi:hypothetical protein